MPVYDAKKDILLEDDLPIGEDAPDMNKHASQSNGPIMIEVTLPGGIARYFRIGSRMLIGVAGLTAISAVCGIGTAGWLAYQKVGGGEESSQKKHAKLVAAEVTKSISEHGALAEQEKTLLQQMSDNLDRFFASASLGGGRGSLSHAITMVDAKLEASMAVEAAVKAKIKSGPTKNLIARGLPSTLPIKIESVSHFSNSDRDIFRVDLSSLNQSKIHSGEVVVAVKYLGKDGEEVFAGCCGKISIDSNGEMSQTSGAMFRVKHSVRKYLEVMRPESVNNTSIKFKIGILTANDRTPIYSDWMHSSKEPIQVSTSEHSQMPSTLSDNDQVSQDEQKRDFEDPSIAEVPKTKSSKKAELNESTPDRGTTMRLGDNQTLAESDVDAEVGGVDASESETEIKGGTPQDAVSIAIRAITDFNGKSARDSDTAKRDDGTVVGQYIDPTETMIENFVPKTKSLDEYRSATSD
ncbi:MAG: hypothetical protein NT027_09710 [Proteobacteria bacterium]|nr:hypothetical protein [Pseudomonadota bacterium]